MSGGRSTPRGVRRTIGHPLRSVLGRLGYQLVSHQGEANARMKPPTDCDPFTATLIGRVAPYTMTTPERIIGLVDAVRYIVRAGIAGAFAECGVWRGGSVMAMVHTLIDCGDTERDIYLYDTFGEIPPPGEHDVMRSGTRVADLLEVALAADELRHLPDEELRRALFGTGYPRERFHLIKGPVEETLPDRAPVRLALCRLDTDLYESTAHELAHLWPRLTPGGVLVIDDYAQFMGAKKAVDEYFDREGPVLLHRLDHSARLVVKPA